LELAKFQTVAEPFYAIMDADENVIATSGMTRNPAEFAAFLQKGAVKLPKGAAAQETAFPAAKTLAGADLDPKAFEGKVVVVNFWATWCVPCLREIPGFNKLHQEYGEQGVVVVGVSMDEEGAAK